MKVRFSLAHPHSFPTTTSDSGEQGVYEIDHIVNHRTRNGRREYQVRWAGYGSERDQWLPLSQLRDAKESIYDYHSRSDAIISFLIRLKEYVAQEGI